MTAKIIAFEGPDRVGKLTQSTRLVDYLRQWGYSAVRVEVPIDGFFYKKIYQMLENGQAKAQPTVFQTVQFINKLTFQLVNLPKLQRENDFIVFDRWKLSGVVYGQATGVPQWINDAMAKVLVEPDLTIVLNGRAHSSKIEDVYEADNTLQMNVRHIYAVESFKPNRSPIFAERPADAVFASVIDTLQANNLLRL